MSEIICKLDFGDYFEIKDNFTIEEYNGNIDNIVYTGNTIYQYNRSEKELFLFLIKENKYFKLFFRGNFEYLNDTDFSVTNASDFILYDILNKQMLLLKSGDVGLFTNKAGKIKVFNKVSCLGRSITLLNNQLNDVNSIIGKFERPCKATFGFNETDNQKDKFDKELIIKGESIIFKNFQRPLFEMNISEIYDLLTISQLRKVSDFE